VLVGATARPSAAVDALRVPTQPVSCPGGCSP
jgi:hypothetical protein